MVRAFYSRASSLWLGPAAVLAMSLGVMAQEQAQLLPPVEIPRGEVPTAVLSFQEAPVAQPQTELPTIPETRVEGTRTPLASPPEASLPTPTPFGQAPSGTLGLGSNLLGNSNSASSGRISQSDLQYRPYVRTGEILETIPGFLALQHSGGGKAAQFSVRGFAMDHGTDFSLYVDGQPINLPSHAHGQGYLDFNFVIPELIEGIEYRLGPYYADVGDFSAAGTAAMRMASRLTDGFVKMETGMYAFNRMVTANSFDLGPGHLLYGIEARYYDSPWQTHEKLQRYSGLLKYTVGDERAGMNVTGQSYYSEWSSTDQQPELAMQQGLIGRFGTLDPTTGGVTFRHGITSEAWVRSGQSAITRANFYATNYHLNLYFNGSGFDDDGSAQIRQEEYRQILGGGLSHQWDTSVFCCRKMTHTLGMQMRNDNIPILQLANSDQRRFVSPISSNSVDQTSASLFYINEFKVSDMVRTYAALRYDRYFFNVTDYLQPANTGHVETGTWSPKGAIIFGPWKNQELFLNFGYGFHSNDARGVVAQVGPDGLPTTAAPGLVKALGYEVGWRSADLVPKLKTTLSLFVLDLGSELIFSGDEGTTVPRGGSHRYGLQTTGYYNITDWWSIDAEFTAAYARFTSPDLDTGGYFIPQSVPFTFTAGTQFKAPCGLFASLRMRGFSPQPLTSDDQFRSRQTVLFNGIVGYQYKRWTLGVEGINLFNSDAPDVSYAYPFRLAPTSPDTLGRLIRPTEPIQARVFVTATF